MHFENCYERMERKCQQFKNGFWDEFQNRSNRGCVKKVVFFDVF
jgi:hypothetical protein